MHSVAGKTYLVTGGTGFLGSALVRGLLDAGARVRSLDDDSRGSAGRLAPVADRVEIVRGDIRDPAAVRDAARGVDGICHLAYINGTEFFYTKPALVLDVAVRGMLNVLDACSAHDIPELVLASSSEVYQTPPRLPTDEVVPLVVPDPMNPRYSYGGGKLISELLSINYARTEGRRLVIFRPHNAYGPDMGWEHVIPQLVVRLARLAAEDDGVIRLPIQGTGQETRAFVYVSDLVGGVLCAMERGGALDIYHVGTDVEVTIESLAKEIGRCLGREVEVVPGRLQPGGTNRRCPDITKLRALGYAPAVSLADGLARTVPWYVDNIARAPAQTAAPR
jgi:nucleoside-diphosphate-sugar epimerase